MAVIYWNILKTGVSKSTRFEEALWKRKEKLTSSIENYFTETSAEIFNRGKSCSATTELKLLLKGIFQQSYMSLRSASII
jgi:hypothetical protein